MIYGLERLKIYQANQEEENIYNLEWREFKFNYSHGYVERYRRTAVERKIKLAVDTAIVANVARSPTKKKVKSTKKARKASKSSTPSTIALGNCSRIKYFDRSDSNIGKNRKVAYKCLRE